LACASRWRVDPVRAEGLLAIVGTLLDADADLDRPPTDESHWSPLRCAVAITTSGRGTSRSYECCSNVARQGRRP
jgi:hypothetical protein